ncbi:MAG: DLW-39 family protein [Bowdeniella nasicola]|nr:DLW-39 family protein [Bowdeniella nasicola]
MKKVLMLAAASAAGYALWLKIQQEREERDIWEEVTDSFGETPEDFIAFQK